jgi:hypothetical protein
MQIACFLLLLSSTFGSANADAVTNFRKLGNNRSVGGSLFHMADCPGKCLTYDETTANVGLDPCKTGGNTKYWEIDYSCGGDESFFQIRHVIKSMCIADPTDCSQCNQDVALVDCDSDEAAWFSHGNIHKSGPKAYNLYSARCWMNEGLIMALSTPSLDAKECPEDQSAEACERLEWNEDRFSKDVLYYEWGFNTVKSECDFSLF